jgi:hypothetical protein
MGDLKPSLLRVPQRKVFSGNGHGVYVANFPLSESISSPEGFELSVHLWGWSQVDYFAYGVYSQADSRFYHLKCSHPPEWAFSDVLRPDSSLWVFSETSEILRSTSSVESVRLFVKGSPAGPSTAGVELLHFEPLVEASPRVQALNVKFLAKHKSSFGKLLSLMSDDRLERTRALIDRGEFRHGDEVITVDQLASGETSDSKHLGFAVSSGIPLMLLIIHHWSEPFARVSELIEPLFFGLDKALRAGSSGATKRVWHPHAVAQRALMLAALLTLSEEEGWRIGPDIEKHLISHCEFLKSESTYSRFDSSRHHNHGLFADVGLYVLAQTLAYPQELVDLAKFRYHETLNHLLREEGKFAVSNENSTHYGNVLMALNEVALALGLSDTRLPGLGRFMEALRFPSGLSPAFGDSEIGATPKTQEMEGNSKEVPGFWSSEFLGYSIINQRKDDHAMSLRMIHSTASSTHKHADNTGFALEADGVQWLIDPGYKDYSQTFDSDYLRSPWAHNLVAVEGREVDPQAGVRVSGRCQGQRFSLECESLMFQGCRIHRLVTGNLNATTLFFRDSIEFAPQKHGRALLILHLGLEVSPSFTPEGVSLAHPSSDARLFIRFSRLPRVVFGRGATFTETSLASPHFGEIAETRSLLVEFGESRVIEYDISLNGGTL